MLIGELRLTQLVYHRAEEPIGDREIEDGITRGTVHPFGLVESAAKLLVQFRFGQIALDTRHLVGKLLPRILVNVINVEFRRGIADKAFQRFVEMISPVSTVPTDRATPISANFSGSTLVRARL